MNNQEMAVIFWKSILRMPQCLILSMLGMFSALTFWYSHHFWWRSDKLFRTSDNLAKCKYIWLTPGTCPCNRTLEYYISRHLMHAFIPGELLLCPVKKCTLYTSFEQTLSHRERERERESDTTRSSCYTSHRLSLVRMYYNYCLDNILLTIYVDSTSHW